MLVDTEISKNIFTLFQVQKCKLKQRRQNVKSTDIRLFKKFFKDDEAKRAQESTKEKDEKIPTIKPGFYFKSIGESEKVKKKKKKEEYKTGAEEIASRINKEIKKEERDDETSESSEEETTTSSDEDGEIKKQSRQEIVVKELDFGLNEQL